MAMAELRTNDVGEEEKQYLSPLPGQGDSAHSRPFLSSEEVSMENIRLFTKPGCPYCVDAKEWLQQHGCPFEALEITKNVQALREWRELSGGVGVPVLAHGKDLVIGFSPKRYSDFLGSCRGTTSVDESEVEAQMQDLLSG